ncbi:UNVERIFIED_CONTAM: hypothetical protein PYX00_002449 [Menopon gallinae]|uniref:Growth hormone-regulated TBC protein 1 n=1 Tax=Menopon gallinae TaxID=328185 RepID=A0AAW2IIQ6_9NEOP
MTRRADKSVFSKVDEYGFERPEDFNYEKYEEFMSFYVTILARRSKKWAELLGDNKVLKRSRRLKRYIRKGIPLEHRGLVWLAVSGAQDLKNNMSDNFYDSLLKQEHNPTITETVKLDLHRTYPDNIFFQTTDHYQNELYNILVAYAHHNPKVGYCQGLNYIAGLLLLATKCEETTFWLLKILVEHILEDYYSSTMEGVIVDIEVLTELIRIMVPDVYEHITSLGLPWAVVTTKWFICLFAEVLPIETVFRIWDCLFYEGSKILFRVGITLIKHNRKQLLACEDFTDAAECFKNMTKDYLVLHCHDFIQSLFKIPGPLSNSTILRIRNKIYSERNILKKEREKKISKGSASLRLTDDA